MNYRHSLRSRRGFTLMEMAVVLGVLGLILAGVWTAGSKVSESTRTNDAVAELRAVSQNILTIMAGQSWPATGNVTASMITAKAIPSAYIDGANATMAINPWNLTGTGLVVTAGAIAPANRTFRLSYAGVPQKGCMALMLQGAACQAGQSGCPLDIVVAGVTTVPNAVTGWQNVMTVATAETECTAAGYTGTVEFDFAL